MSPERWRQIEELYQAAWERGPEALAQADPELRFEVERMLAQKSVDSPLDRPATEMLLDSTETQLVAGVQLGPYRIEARLGKGGMGEVYRALDTRLSRAVAIKVAHDRFSDRFEREARAIAALNHPHICALYDVGPSYLVMELVEGETLAARLKKGKLSIEQTIQCGAQIAGALAAAHAAGIIHRDLKPSNIMIAKDGVKVLDFGLAKFSQSRSGVSASTQTQTVEHAIIGTLAYMSPEQGEGKKVDARSDIFSFGSVLYEMVTGRRAFQGETGISTLSAIVHKDPPPIEGVPPELERIIMRCLRKDLERRSQHMDDVKLALVELKENSAPSRVAVPVTRRRWARMSTALIIAGAFMLAAGAVAWIWRLAQPAYVAPTPILTRLTSDSGLTTDPALSPDGKLLAYASDRSGEGNLDIYVRQVGGNEPLRLTRDPADDHEPTFSPDGTKIAFRSEREGGGIYVVSALGGPARKLAAEGKRPQFSPDGNWIAYWVGSVEGALFSVPNASRIYLVASAGGTPKQVQPGFVAAAYPTWSPDGKHLLFLGERDHKLPLQDSIDWWIAPLDSGLAVRTGAFEATRREKLLGPLQVYPWALVAPIWQHRDSLIFFARCGDSTNLWRIRISPNTWKVTGGPQRVTSGPTLEVNPSAASMLTGAVRVAFASLNENVDVWSLPIDANQGKVVGELKQLTDDAAADFHPALSSDENKMAFISARSGNQEIWIKDLRSGEYSAVTASRSNKYQPLFSPDGSKLTFSSQDSAGQINGNIYLVPTGGGAPELVCADCGQLSSWSSDGKSVLGNSVNGQVWLLDLAARRKTQLLGQPDHWFCCPHFSPDNRWIAFFDAKSAQQMYTAPLRGEHQIGADSWISVGGFLWSPDGTVLYSDSYRDGFLCLWSQRVDPATKRPTGPPFAIFHSHNARRSLANQNDLSVFVSRSQLVFSMGERTGNIWLAEWKEP